MIRRELKGRVVLITGAAGGLGGALCQRYAAAGARIAALDLDAARLVTLAVRLRAKGADVLAVPGDITSPAACKSAVASTLAHFGALDGLINNAGISHRSLLRDTDPDVIRRVMEVNFFGAANLTQAALEQIVAQRGFIVAISSVAATADLQTAGSVMSPGTASTSVPLARSVTARVTSFLPSRSSAAMRAPAAA